MSIIVNYRSNIEYYMQLRGFKKVDLFTKAEMSRSSFDDMMKRNSFSTNNLEKLAKALDVTVADLVKDRSVDKKQEALKDISEIKKRLDEFEEKHLK